MSTSRLAHCLRLCALKALVLLTACAEPDGAGADAAADPAALSAERGALIHSIDQRLDTFDGVYADLEGRLSSASAEAREEVDEDLDRVAEERWDVVALREETLRAETQGELRTLRAKIREEFHDLDELLTEARLALIDEYPDFRAALQSEITNLQDEVDSLERESDRLDDATYARYDSVRSALEKRRQELVDRLDATTEDNWQDMRRGLIDAWQHVKEAFRDLPAPDADARAE